MVHFSKRFLEEDLNRITKLIVECCKAMLKEAVTATA